MQIYPLHSWNLAISDAIQLQRQLAKDIDTRAPL